MKSIFKTTGLVLAMAAALGGCASTSSFTPIAAPAPPQAFKEDSGARFVQSAPADNLSRGPWWQVFQDAVLNDLETRAAAGNTSLQAAAARVTQARALLQAASAELLPQVGVGTNAQRVTVPPALASHPGEVGNPATAGLNASWEPDFFNKLGQARDAAHLDARSREALFENTRLVVQAEVAQVYFKLRHLDTERALVRQTVAAYQDTLRLTQRRFEDGDVDELDLARVRAEVASTTAQALALDLERSVLEHALAVLLGELPSHFGLATIDGWQGALPIVPAGLPSTLLARRPDVAAAQLAMQAAEQRFGVARKAWFPDVSLTASGGYASTNVDELFKWSARAWGVGALLSLPLIDGGRRDAAIKQSEAQWDVAAAAYRDQVLTAFRDVEDQLASLRLLADRCDAEGQAVDAAARATRLSDLRYREGLVSQLELLDAQRSELAGRRAAVQVRAAQYQAAVGLIRALGGGWAASSSLAAF